MLWGTGLAAWGHGDRSWLVQEGKKEKMGEGGIRLGSGRNTGGTGRLSPGQPKLDLSSCLLSH